MTPLVLLVSFTERQTTQQVGMALLREGDMAIV